MEAKVIRERERAERDRLKNRKTEAQIKVREQKGGVGMQLLFFRNGKGKRGRKR